MLGKNCCCNAVFYVGNKRCCIVLYSNMIQAFLKPANASYAIDNNMYLYCFKMHAFLHEILVYPLTPSNGGTRHCYLSGVRLGLSSPMYTRRHRPTRSSPEAGSLPATGHKRDSVTKYGFILSVLHSIMVTCCRICIYMDTFNIYLYTYASFFWDNWRNWNIMKG